MKIILPLIICLCVFEFSRVYGEIYLTRYAYKITENSGNVLSASHPPFLLQVGSGISSGSAIIINHQSLIEENELSMDSKAINSYSFGSIKEPVLLNDYAQTANGQHWAFNTAINSTFLAATTQGGSEDDGGNSGGSPLPEPKTYLTLFTLLGIVALARVKTCKT